MFKYDVLCVGSATVDNFLTINIALKSINPGDKVLVQTKEMHSGGGATNSAATLSKLGLKVKMLTKVGDDHEAEYISKEMKQYGVKNISLHYSKKPTDSATIISSPVEKDRVIYVQKGASRDLKSTDYHKRDMNCRWIYLASLVGKSFTTAKELAEIHHKKNILFNPSLYLAKKGKIYLKKVLEATTVLVLNKEEAQVLFGKKTNSWKVLLEGLHSLGPDTVVVTNGHSTFYALHEDKMFKIIPPNVPRIHTAGAGDCFAASLMAGMIHKLDFKEVLSMAQANASSLIQQIGTKKGLCSMTEVKKLMKKYKTKVTSN
jgi:ribokinase